MERAFEYGSFAWYFAKSLLTAAKGCKRSMSRKELESCILSCIAKEWSGDINQHTFKRYVYCLFQSMGSQQRDIHNKFTGIAALNGSGYALDRDILADIDRANGFKIFLQSEPRTRCVGDDRFLRDAAKIFAEYVCGEMHVRVIHADALANVIHTRSFTGGNGFLPIEYAKEVVAAMCSDNASLYETTCFYPVACLLRRAHDHMFEVKDDALQRLRGDNKFGTRYVK